MRDHNVVKTTTENYLPKGTIHIDGVPYDIAWLTIRAEEEVLNPPLYDGRYRPEGLPEFLSTELYLKIQPIKPLPLFRDGKGLTYVKKPTDGRLYFFYDLKFIDITEENGVIEYIYRINESYTARNTGGSVE